MEPRLKRRDGFMARPLRRLVVGRWCHVTVRGNRRNSLFCDEQDRRGFLGLVAAWPGYSGIDVPAFVRMDNQYHLLLRTPEPNLL